MVCHKMFFLKLNLVGDGLICWNLRLRQACLLIFTEFQAVSPT
jgi:hypothetical protein